MNRALLLEPDGSTLLQPGGFYRLLLRVAGPTAVEDLEAVLVRLGFEQESLIASHPNDWRDEAPPDWPVENAVRLAAGECLVRASGVFQPEAGAALAIGETAIVDGASFSIPQAWQYEPPRHATGQAAAPVQQKKPLMGPAGAALLSGGVLIGLGLWSNARRKARLDAETKRLFSTVTETEKSELDVEAAGFEAQGHSPEHARLMAERQLRERTTIRAYELDLEEG